MVLLDVVADAVDIAVAAADDAGAADVARCHDTAAAVDLAYSLGRSPSNWPEWPPLVRRPPSGAIFLP